MRPRCFNFRFCCDTSLISGKRQRLLQEDPGIYYVRRLSFVKSVCKYSRFDVKFDTNY